ncbi:MAG TPA: nucleotidyltransferase family protein [Candidatus Eisenbacteria bacterium]|nr:nucleotidyltransferase family protein [Candidatus Eisenbacteria bacterium]
MIRSPILRDLCIPSGSLASLAAGGQVYTPSSYLSEMPLTQYISRSGKPFGNEWRFLCACASPLPLPTAKLSSLTEGLNWDALLELAGDHRVLGVVAARCRETGFAEVPDRAREKLQSRMRAQQLFSLSMTAELFRILEQFERAGIESLLVKGPLVSQLAYGDPSVRSYVDLDLIVRHEAILRASQIMSAQGFEADVPEEAIRAEKIPGEYLFGRAGTREMVELHTEKTFRYYPRPMRIADLFARQRQVLLDGKPIRTLSLEDEFVLNCIHGAKHFWERLMWTADIAAMVTRCPEINWRQTRRAAEDVGAGRMLRVALLLAESLLQAPVPEEMAAETKADVTARNLVQQILGWMPGAGYTPPPLAQRAMFRVRMGGGLYSGGLYLLRLSLSPTEDDWRAEEGQQSSRIWGAMKRPFRLLRKYGQGG